MNLGHAARTALLMCASTTIAACAAAEGVPDTVVTSRLALRDDMRQLWTEDATWTRVVIVSSIAGIEDTPAATERLMQNAAERAEAIRPFYGSDAAYDLTALLYDRVTGTLQLIAATLGNDPIALEDAHEFAYSNADSLARFLADANSELDYYALYRMLTFTVDQTVVEMTARTKGDYESDVKAHDAIVEAEIDLADVLTDGIVEDRPEQVDTAGPTSREESLHLTQRVLWQDHVSWLRFFIIDAAANLPSLPATAARLFANQDALGEAIRQIYGGIAAEQLTELLYTHVELTADFVAATVAGDNVAAVNAQNQWYSNARDVAHFYAGITASWAFDPLAQMMAEHVDQTSAETIARVAEDWDQDIATFDLATSHILHMSDVIATLIDDDLSRVSE